MLFKKILLTALACFALTAWSADLPTKFDPKRDAAKDLALAVSLAKAQGKRVMVDVGGEWCSWCHLLDNFVTTDPEVKALLDKSFVWVKVNYSPENKNTELLSQWPTIKGYPFLFVLDKQGALVTAQGTGELEAGKGYDKNKVLAFLNKYAQPTP